MSVFRVIQSKCEKMRARITLNTGNFRAVILVPPVWNRILRFWEPFYNYNFVPGWTQPCVWSNLLQCLKLKNWKKNSLRGELTPPVLTGMKFSLQGELMSNELYMHVFTRPGWHVAQFLHFLGNFLTFFANRLLWAAKIT